MKRLFSNWQGGAALLVAACLFYFSPHLLRALDPTAGTFDLGYLQRPLVAAAYFFFATFCVFLAIQIDWPTADRWVDDGGFREDWKMITPRFRIVLFVGLWFLLLLAFLACLALVPT